MKINILEKPKLKRVKMMCDYCIDPKLENIKSIENCFSRHNFTIIAGLQGSGKTTLTIQLLRDIMGGIFENLYVIIPEISLNSINKKDNIFKNELEEDEHLYYEYTSENLQNIYDKLSENSLKGYNSMVIIDDFGSQFRTDKEAEKILNKIIIKMRHLRVSVWLLAQGITQLPLKWRQMSTNLIMYNLGKSQMERVFDEFFRLSKSKFQEVMTLFKKPHDLLIMNIKHNKLYFNWDEVILED